MKKVFKRLKTVIAVLIILSVAPIGGLFHDSVSGLHLFAPSAESASGACVSGYVYEAVISNRIEGATATLYYQDAAGNPVLWDPGQSGQKNPQTTNEAGAYYWEVPYGTWNVEITKENYRKATSGWANASSAGKETAIPIVTTVAPEVVGMVEKKDCVTLTFTQYMDISTVNTRNVVFTNNGRSVAYEMWPANSEVSGTTDGVFYAKAFNFTPVKAVSSFTVQNVKNYVGITLKNTYRIATKDIPHEVEFSLGDVDSDGGISAADARLALRAAVGLSDDGAVNYNFGKGTKHFLSADYDGNGRIDAEDARLILRVSVGLELKDSSSGLVTYTKLTDKYDKRTHRIDKITIHHMAEKKTAKQCCDYFYATTREVSANYCIGYDGSVGMSVDEKYRAWTSASEANDMRAVTIEVSNDGGAPNWHVSDVALAKLIDLCVDICRRNGISKLVYTGNAYGNLTMHKMFVATGCPGPYLGGKFPYIAEQVNKRLQEMQPQ